MMIKGTPSKSHNYLIKQLPSATAFIDAKFEVIYASDKWIKDFEFTNIDVIGKTLFELFDGLNDTWITILSDCLKGKPCEGKRETYMDGDGQEKQFECAAIPWYDDNENIVGVIIQTENITQKQLEELRREKLQLLLDTKSEISKIGSWEYDVTQQELFWCPMTKILHEVPSDYEPTVEKALQFYKEGYSRNTISMALFKGLEQGNSWKEKLQMITAKGNEIWVIIAGKPIYKNGKIVSIIGTFQDINDQVLNDLKTRENEQLLQTLIDNLPLNVYIKDLESRKILVNKSECQFLGVKNSAELLGKSDFEIYGEEMAKIFWEEDFNIINTLKPIMGKESIIVRKNGIPKSFLVSKIPLIGDDGKAYGLVGISMDITELKQKEDELRGLINVTSLQNKKLINFAHIVSHNLRSHAANFSMLLEFLVNEQDTSERQKIMEMLVNASDNLMETLDNLNEVVAINRNIKLEKQSINLNEKIHVVEQQLSGFLKKNKAVIINEIPDDTCVRVIPEYIESILTNFITNAVKYRRPGEPPIINLSVGYDDQHTILRIRDNGQGIDLKKYGDKLFGMYKTFHNTKESRGIGLFITKNQIEAMNGKIITQSEVGQGTTFNIYFNGKN